MPDFVRERAPLKGDRRDAEKMQSDVRKLINKARSSEYYFLIYILGMALQELDNIEKGYPTSIAP
ncbi:hypothetical protein BJF91_11905 [Allorhizobium taibaishanense]|uniref:Uncharacterized protein n=1 Tax=Allorhizobium taibaishanense TaxID=887144 RepID=A0A1Q9A629_9HYPH|nr:hypothetical protein BJF91_11905 [Allorhizobium taibaishanense]